MVAIAEGRWRRGPRCRAQPGLCSVGSAGVIPGDQATGLTIIEDEIGPRGAPADCVSRDEATVSARWRGGRRAPYTLLLLEALGRHFAITGLLGSGYRADYRTCHSREQDTFQKIVFTEPKYGST